MSKADIDRYNRQKATGQLKIGLFIGVVLAAITCIIHYLNIYTGMTAGFWVWLFTFATLAVLIWSIRHQRPITESNLPLKAALPGFPVASFTEENNPDALAIMPKNMVQIYDNSYIKLRNGGVAILSILPLSCLLSGEWWEALICLLFPLGFMHYVLPRIRENLSKSKALASQAPTVGLMLKPDGFICNKALVYSEWALEKNEAIREWKWNEFSFLSVQSERARSRNTPATPPYYKFVLKTPYNAHRTGNIPGLEENNCDAICILRKPFYGREREILDYIKAHSDMSVEMNDVLR